MCTYFSMKLQFWHICYSELLVDCIKNSTLGILKSPKSKTVRTVKPNFLKPEPKRGYLLEPIETGTECCLKLKTGTHSGLP